MVRLDVKAAYRQVVASFKQLDETDLRWTHLAIIGMVVAGGIVNCFLDHGWTVWPLVMAAALMTAVSEAADRAGQGVPPLVVYAGFAGAMVVWIGSVMILSQVPLIVIFAAIVAVSYFSIKGWLKVRLRRQLIESRIAHGLCVNCGQAVSPNIDLCENCGLPPNPTLAESRHLADVTHRRANAAHARAVLTGESMAASASRKEQALLAMRRAGKKPKR